MNTNRMKKAQPLQRSAALATAALLIFAAALVCTGCPGGSGQKNPGGSGSLSSAIGSYNAASGTLTVGSVTYMMKKINAENNATLGAASQPGNKNHTAKLKEYWIGETEVTQELWMKVMGSNPSQFNGIGIKVPAGGDVQLKRPVDTVTWFDCIDFCNKLTDGIAGLGPSERVYTVSGSGSGKTVTQNLSKKGFRLPTEAEWEWAARGGNLSNDYSGDTVAGNVAWFSGNSNHKTHEGGKKAANAYGLYDMSGNVAEWCWDIHENINAGTNLAEDYAGPIVGSRRVRRGGDYSSPDSSCKCVFRVDEEPDYTEDHIGFRIVCRP